MKKKIVITTGTRADYGFLRPLLKRIQSSKHLELLLIVTGTHLSKKHGYTINEIKKDGFSITKKFKMLPNSDENFSTALELGKGIISFSKCFRELKPDINIILGDRHEMFASALAAYNMKIINAHIHGGDVSGGLDEYNRHAITKISNIHFTATKKSKERIIKMGENRKFVFFTGSPSIDEIKSNRITSKKILEEKYKIHFIGKEIILIQHPVTTESADSEKQILATLEAVLRTRQNIIVIAPNSDSGHRKIFKQLKFFSKQHKNIKLYSSIPREDYLGMLRHAGILVGNSSSGMIEASYFSIPVVNIGIRQKNRERGDNVIDVNSFSQNQIFKAIKINLKNRSKIKQKKNKIYGDGTASIKIVKILEKINLDENLIKKQLAY